MLDKKDIHASPLVLVVDDQDYTLDMIETFLTPAGYEVQTALNGLEAWNKLTANPGVFSAVLLDRSMPEAGEFRGGLDVLKKMKTHDALKKIPVILQTGMTEEKHIVQGLEAGAYYYLSKPYKKKILLAIVNAAVRDYAKSRVLSSQAQEIVDALIYFKHGQFEFRTLDAGQKLATFMASMCPDKDDVVVGLWELVVNAVEHGNLGIGYQEKTVLNEKDEWEDEIRRRLELPEFKKKKVTLEVEREMGEVRFTITDEGTGFDYDSYLEFDPNRLFDNHGRGIAMANKFSFDRLEYRGCGNTVTAVVKH